MDRQTYLEQDSIGQTNLPGAAHQRIDRPTRSRTALDRQTYLEQDSI